MSKIGEVFHSAAEHFPSQTITALYHLDRLSKLVPHLGRKESALAGVAGLGFLATACQGQERPPAIVRPAPVDTSSPILIASDTPIPGLNETVNMNDPLKLEFFYPEGQKPIPQDLNEQLNTLLKEPVERIIGVQAIDQQDKGKTASIYFVETRSQNGGINKRWMALDEKNRKYVAGDYFYAAGIDLGNGQVSVEQKAAIQGNTLMKYDLSLRIQRKQGESKADYEKRIKEQLKSPDFQLITVAALTNPDKVISVTVANPYGGSVKVDLKGNSDLLKQILSGLNPAKAYAAEIDTESSEKEPVVTPEDNENPEGNITPTPLLENTEQPIKTPVPPKPPIEEPAVTGTPVTQPSVTEEPPPPAEVKKEFPSPENETLQDAIESYAKVMGIEATSVSLTYKEMEDKQGNFFIVTLTADGTPLLITEKNQRGEYVWQPATMKVLGEKTGMLMGAFFGGNRMTPDDFNNISSLVNSDFSVGGIFTGMSVTQPNENQFTLQNLRWMINNFKGVSQLMIHPVIWKENEPLWMKNKKGEARLAAVQNQVSAIMEEVKKNKLARPPIVVVYNEADDPNSEEIDLAFQIARNIMPEAILIYNDYDNETFEGKRYQITKNIVDRLRLKGIVDGVGIQYRKNRESIPDESKIMEAIESYGMPVYVTEHGVDIRNVKGSIQDRFEKQAEGYYVMARAAVKSGVKVFIDFQLGDKFSVWQDPSYPYSASNSNTTPYNDDLTPKPALFAQKRALIESLLD